MVLFFTLTLAVSALGMAGLLGLKRYELDTGKMVMADLRPVVGGFFNRVAHLTAISLPTLFRTIARHIILSTRALMHYVIAQSVLKIEHMLERVLHTMREKTSPPRAPGEASAFLREVADHKRQILKRRPRMRKQPPVRLENKEQQ